MDASDAAEFVQDLAGEEANIIFGAMYDDSRADEATITVIATGLHNVEGSASKLKSRLENRTTQAGTVYNREYERERVAQPVRTQSHIQQHAKSSQKLDAGMASAKSSASASGQQVRRSMGGTAPTLETPRTPTSKVKEQSIKIPDFFKK